MNSSTLFSELFFLQHQKTEKIFNEFYRYTNELIHLYYQKEVSIAGMKIGIDRDKIRRIP